MIVADGQLLVAQLLKASAEQYACQQQTLAALKEIISGQQQLIKLLTPPVKALGGMVGIPAVAGFSGGGTVKDPTVKQKGIHATDSNEVGTERDRPGGAKEVA